MKRFCKLLAIGLCLSSFAGTALGFDGNREGFVFGIGVGGHLSFERPEFFSHSDDYEIKNDYGGWGTSFRLGGGVNDKTILYFANEANFFKNEYSNDLIVTTLTGVGLNVYNSPEPEELYGGFIFGLASSRNLSNHEMPKCYGLGFDVLFGYEMAKFVSLQTDFLRSWVNGAEASDTKEIYTCKLALQFNFY